MESSASPVPEANHGYRPPSYRPRYRKGPTHTHHHYYHRGAPKEYVRPSYDPSYHAPQKPSYHAPPAYPDYAAPARRPIRYAPNYGNFKHWNSYKNWWKPRDDPQIITNYYLIKIFQIMIMISKSLVPVTLYTQVVKTLGCTFTRRRPHDQHCCSVLVLWREWLSLL